jgi:hypothetical protein
VELATTAKSVEWNTLKEKDAKEDEGKLDKWCHLRGKFS